MTMDFVLLMVAGMIRVFYHIFRQLKVVKNGSGLEFYVNFGSGRVTSLVGRINSGAL